MFDTNEVINLGLELTVHNFIGGRYRDPHKGVYQRCPTNRQKQNLWLVPRSCPRVSKPLWMRHIWYFPRGRGCDANNE